MLALSLPLIKIPLLISNAIMYKISLTSPNPPADTTEQKKYASADKTKDWLSSQQRWCPGALRMSVYIFTVFEILSIFSALALASRTSNYRFQITITPMFLIGSLLIHAGTILRMACYKHLGRHFTFELTLRDNHKLVSDGPYGIVRHPSYTGSALVFAGCILVTTGLGSWWNENGLWDLPGGQVVGGLWVAANVLTAFALMSRVPKEDLVMKTEFKEQWVAWSQKTPYALVPYVY